MMRKIFGTAAMLLISLQTLFAQTDSTKSVTISGSVDGYYRYNFNNAGGVSNNKTSFTNSQNSFALGMATIRADATALSGKVTATVDLGFGPRADEFSYNETGLPSTTSGASLKFVKQLYLTYNLSKNVKITAGKFATHVGYEVMDAPLNRNYSMSYMFTNGPFSHTGVKFDFTAGQLGFMVGVANFIDQTVTSTSTKTLIAQVSGGSKDGKLKVYLNYAGFFGANQGATSTPLIPLKSFNQLDLVATGIITSKFNIGFNATMQDRTQPDIPTGPSGTWYAAAVYLNLDPTPAVGLTLRSEMVSDSKFVLPGSFSGNGLDNKSIFANTLSLNYKVGPFTLIPELRFETAQSAIYTKNDGTSSSSTATALLAAVYKF